MRKLLPCDPIARIFEVRRTGTTLRRCLWADLQPGFAQPHNTPETIRHAEPDSRRLRVSVVTRRCVARRSQGTASRELNSPGHSSTSPACAEHCGSRSPYCN